MTTIAVPQGDTRRPIVPTFDTIPTLAHTGPQDAKATRLDVTILALAYAQAQHRANPTEENTLRLTAAEVSYADAEVEYLTSTSFEEDDL